MTDIHSPYTLGRIQLQNRFVMAPMTRARANADGTPGQLAAEYYGQRAGVGLTITEGTQPSDDGQGYPLTPGIYTDGHVAGWKTVNDAIHARGGHVFYQLMHAGRMSHPDNTPHHRQGVAPSAIAPGEQIYTLGGMKDIPVPRALSTEEVQATVKDYAYAARRAIESGADGVEIHGIAYLIHQFLAVSANQRTDRYGGSLENRARFAIEVAQAVVAEIGADRTGIRLSPGFGGFGLNHGDEGPDMFRYLVGELNTLGLAYIHVVHYGDDGILHDFRRIWDQAIILNRPGRPREDIGKDVASGLADLESYGAMVLANPDFIERITSGAPLNSADHSVFFGVGRDGPASGYTDFPTLADGAGKAENGRFQAMVRLKIHAGKLNEFKKIAGESIRLAREKDTGTIRYDIFLNDDETEAVVYEEFVNPAARLEHLANLGDNVTGMLAIVHMTAEVWSHSDPELRASTKGYDVKFYKPLLRFDE
jgi:2,4-dienoyl-CoA reductase-like NADH-dependent reductase (Old Yellow Enzyme family)/quinol monooxygenase YgiN